MITTMKGTEPFGYPVSSGDSSSSYYSERVLWQPLHYLTNVQMKKFDQMRHGADNEDVPLDTIIYLGKAEATI
ncbi:hypothetical protein RDI58_024505 [Solanum bulbocastanum]|uniref:Uncharacterized protein n=1 Tax=Solanum bulbocastanum TaxID=147425 RepID=A0AAN8T203_SOLBU